jgi:hypothetical protein
MQYRGQDRIRRMANGRLCVSLTSGQQDPLGIVVGHIYYNNSALNSMIPQFNWHSTTGPVGSTRLESTGYPHNGGEHTLELYGPQAEIQAFLEIAGEHYLALGEHAPRYKDGGHELMYLAAQLTTM